MNSYFGVTLGMSGKIAKALTCAPAKPFRMWIDGKCFNLKRFNDKWKKHSSKNSHEDCIL